MKTDLLTSTFMTLRDRLHRSALKLLRDDEDARDALQDTFSKLWQRDTIRSDTEARNKLFAVLRNVCIDRLRKPSSIPLEDADLSRYTVQPHTGEDLEKLEQMLTAGLSPIQIKIYELVTKQGTEYDETARKLGMSVEAVRMNMSRARKKIKDNCNKLDI